jgi:hypothetical protein
MAVFGIVIIPGAVEVGGHEADVVTAVLMTVGVAEFDARDFGQSIGLVRRLQGTGQQSLFDDRLRGHFGVNTGRTQKQKLGHSVAVRGLDQVGLDHEVIVEKLGAVGVVGVDTPHLCRSDHHIIGTMPLKVSLDGCLVARIQFAAARAEQAGITAGLK